MAENCVVPLLVITTIKAHTDNFRLELEARAVPHNGGG